MPCDLATDAVQIEDTLAEPKSAWHRPRLKRFCASDAETADTVSGEGGSGLS